MLLQGTRWASGWDLGTLEVVRLYTLGKGWSVSLRRGANKRQRRRVSKHCAYGLSKTKAEELSGRILQGFVLGKLQ